MEDRLLENTGLEGDLRTDAVTKDKMKWFMGSPSCGYGLVLAMEGLLRLESQQLRYRLPVNVDLLRANLIPST